MIIKIGNKIVVVRNIETYLYDKKTDCTELIMCSGQNILVKGDITQVISSLLNATVSHEYHYL